jgi:hypothetical protein
MKRSIIAMLSAVMLLGVLAAPAMAWQEGDTSNAANNQSQCTTAGGVYSEDTTTTPKTTYCTITIDGDSVVFENAGQSENGWTLVEATVVVVEKDTGQGEVISVDEIEECYNPGGKLMKPGTGKCP